MAESFSFLRGENGENDSEDLFFIQNTHPVIKCKIISFEKKIGLICHISIRTDKIGIFFIDFDKNVKFLLVGAGVFWG